MHSQGGVVYQWGYLDDEIPEAVRGQTHQLPHIDQEVENLLAQLPALNDPLLKVTEKTPTVIYCPSQRRKGRKDSPAPMTVLRDGNQLTVRQIHEELGRVVRE